MEAFPRSTGFSVTHMIRLSESQKQRYQSLSEILQDRDMILKEVEGEQLVKGDLISVGRLYLIFDGTKLIELSRVSTSSDGFPPQDFHVIESKVPINYWDDLQDRIVWFNHSLVQKECLNNIKYGLINKYQYAIYTTFIYDKVEYRIIFDYVLTEVKNGALNIEDDGFELKDEARKSKYLEDFKQILSMNRTIPFHNENPDDGYYNIDRKTTLFLPVNVQNIINELPQ